LFGRRAGRSQEGTWNSPALVESGIVWSIGHLAAFLDNPSGYIPGTLMTYVGLRGKPQDTADIIAFIRESGNLSVEQFKRKKSWSAGHVQAGIIRSETNTFKDDTS